MILSLLERSDSRETKITVSLLDLNVIKITTRRDVFGQTRLVRNNNPADFLWLLTGKEHALGTLGRYYRQIRYSWKVANIKLYFNL